MGGLSGRLSFWAEFIHREVRVNPGEYESWELMGGRPRFSTVSTRIGGGVRFQKSGNLVRGSVIDAARSELIIVERSTDLWICCESGGTRMGLLTGVKWA